MVMYCKNTGSLPGMMEYKESAVLFFRMYLYKQSQAARSVDVAVGRLGRPEPGVASQQQPFNYLTDSSLKSLLFCGVRLGHAVGQQGNLSIFMSILICMQENLNGNTRI